jgi:hypothetical protein
MDGYVGLGDLPAYIRMHFIPPAAVGVRDDHDSSRHLYDRLVLKLGHIIAGQAQNVLQHFLGMLA